MEYSQPDTELYALYSDYSQGISVAVPFTYTADVHPILLAYAIHESFLNKCDSYGLEFDDLCSITSGADHKIQMEINQEKFPMPIGYDGSFNSFVVTDYITIIREDIIHIDSTYPIRVPAIKFNGNLHFDRSMLIDSFRVANNKLFRVLYSNATSEESKNEIRNTFRDTSYAFSKGKVLHDAELVYITDLNILIDYFYRDLPDIFKN